MILLLLLAGCPAPQAPTLPASPSPGVDLASPPPGPTLIGPDPGAVITAEIADRAAWQPAR